VRTVSRFDFDAREPFEATGHRVNPAFVSKNDSEVLGEPVAHRVHTDWPLIPWSRGPLSAALITALRGAPGDFRLDGRIEVEDALSDDDFQLALYLCHEARYRDFAGNDWEWDSGLLAFRAQLEQVFTTHLRYQVTRRHPRRPTEIADELDQVIFASTSRSLTKYFLSRGTLDEMRELFVHRSASFSHDTQSPEVRAHPGDVAHSEAFATTMVALGLDPSLGSYVEVLPGVTLSMINLQSMFSLQERWRAALIGHFAVLEMTSGGRVEKWGRTLSRFGLAAAPLAVEDHDARVDDNTHYASLARARMLSGLLAVDEGAEGDVLFGATATLVLDQMFCDHVLSAWEHHRSSLVPWELTD
jgi:hypothetical protein